MIDRRAVCVGAGASAFMTTSLAVAMPGGRLRAPGPPQWTYAQNPKMPPIRAPKPEELADSTSFGRYLQDTANIRIKEAGIEIEAEGRAAIDEAVKRSVDAAFRPPKGEIQKGANYDALPVEVRRVVVVRNFNTFIDVVIIVAWQEGKKLTQKVVSRVQGFLCPLYPVCTG